jgi:hypothetical protein
MVEEDGRDHNQRRAWRQGDPDDQGHHGHDGGGRDQPPGVSAAVVQAAREQALQKPCQERHGEDGAGGGVGQVPGRVQIQQRVGEERVLPRREQQTDQQRLLQAAQQRPKVHELRPCRGRRPPRRPPRRWGQHRGQGDGPAAGTDISPPMGRWRWSTWLITARGSCG